MADRNKNIVFGLYDDEVDLLNAVKHANKDHLEIMDVYSPFPVHGLDPLLGLEESRLHIVGFIFGALGTLTALGFMSWTFVSDWPIVFGGKPYWPLPSFIPITFELTVLFAAVGMVVVFYIISGLGPGVEAQVLDNRITDDKFCIAFDTHETDAGTAESFFAQTGASEVHKKTLKG